MESGRTAAENSGLNDAHVGNPRYCQRNVFRFSNATKNRDGQPSTLLCSRAERRLCANIRIFASIHVPSAVASSNAIRCKLLLSVGLGIPESERGIKALVSRED
jgi:hypothetical protein